MNRTHVSVLPRVRLTDASMRTWFLSKRAEIDKRERTRRLSPREALVLAELGWTSKAAIVSAVQDMKLDLKLRATLPGAIERGLEPLRRALGRA